MDLDTPDNWDGLSPLEQAAYCLKAACEAESQAKVAPPAMRRICQRLADQWHELAAEIRKKAGIVG